MTDYACSCPACEKKLTPFTVEHFRRWAHELVLDTGKPWVLDEFQEAYVEDLFAFTRGDVPAEAWLVVPEGNGKTTLVAGLALYYLEHTPQAFIPVAASARDQTKPLFGQMEGFIVRTPRLRAPQPNFYEQAKGKRPRDVPRLDAQEGYRRIKFHRGGEVQIYAADEGTADGVIPRGLMILDELHRHKSLRLYRLWLGKGEKTGAVLSVISTAGEPGSEFEETREAVRQGDVVERSNDGCHVRSLSESAVLHEHAVPEGGDVEDLALVALANPLKTITEATLARKRRKKSWTLAHWRRFTCNLATRSVLAAITEQEWAKAKRDHVIPQGEPRWLGLDVGWKVDTTAIVPLWVTPPIDDDDPMRYHALLGEATILEPPTDGTSLAPEDIKIALRSHESRGPIVGVVMDTTRAEDIASWIESDMGVQVVDRSQTNALAAIDHSRFVGALRNGWLRHVGDPGLTRHAMNAIARVLSADAAKFDRPRRATYRRGEESDNQRSRWIDALIAAAMVHTAATNEFYDAEEQDEEQEPLLAWV